MRTTLTLLALVLFGIVGVVFVVPQQNSAADQPEQYSWAHVEQSGVAAAQAFILPVVETSYLPFRDSAVTPPTLDARAAVLYDTRSGRMLFEQHPDEQMPIASLTKLLTVLVAHDLFSPDEVVTVPSEAVKVDGERQDLYAGEQMTVGNLIRYMLVGSSNDAAYALALHAKAQGVDFITRMNAKAAALGMEDTHVMDPAGLNDLGRSTARDVVLLMTTALRDQSLWPDTREEQITITSESGQTHEVHNTNQLLDSVPDIIAGKTGNTDGALGCLALAVRAPGKDDILISVVLGSHQRFTDTQTLIEWVQRAYRWE